MDYSWLQTECNEITSETFFRREALELGVKDHLEAAGVPVTFIKFLEQFGNCQFFRNEEGQYAMSVKFVSASTLGVFQLSSRKHRGFFRRMSDGKYETTVSHYADSGRIVALNVSFPEWLKETFYREKKRYSIKRWNQLRISGDVLNDFERQVITSRAMWKIEQLKPDGDLVKLRITNNSLRSFRVISLRAVAQNGFDEHIHIDTEDIKPGQSAERNYDFYKQDPTTVLIKPFTLRPEDRTWATEFEN